MFFLPLCIKILNFSTCIKDPKISQYDCYNERLNERLKTELYCLRPFQVHNKLDVGLGACKNLTELDGKCDTLVQNEAFLFGTLL